MPFIKVVMIYFLGALGFSSAHGTQFIITGDSEFIAIGRPSAFKIHGQGDGVTGKINMDGSKVTGAISFPLNKFATGVDLRDKHMKEKYLETPKYPMAQLTINQVKLSRNPASEGYSGKQIPFSGVLTLHGMKHVVNGTIDVGTSEGVTKGDAQFELKITDFKIPVPKYLGITVADTVKITVHIEAKKAKAG